MTSEEISGTGTEAGAVAMREAAVRGSGSPKEHGDTVALNGVSWA
ncbi:hypothetical protein ACFY0F_02825 [Streptomyces sp. NPDC001544]